MQLLWAGHMPRFVPLCHDGCLLDSPEHTADTSALIHHGGLGPQGPGQGLLWQLLSPDSEDWKTEGSETCFEGSSSRCSFRDTLEVTTPSWILPHHFPSHHAISQRNKSCINLLSYTNPDFGQLLQVPQVILFTPHSALDEETKHKRLPRVCCRSRFLWASVHGFCLDPLHHRFKDYDINIWHEYS